MIDSLYRLRAWSVLHGYTWSTISALMKSRAARIVAAIPFVGYLLLLSQELQKYLGPLGVGERLAFVFFGGLAMAVALFLFWIRCPTAVRRHSAVEDYVREMDQTADDATHREIIGRVRRLITGSDMEGTLSFTNEAGELIRANMTALDVRRAVVGTNQESPRALYRAEYLTVNESRFWSLTVVFFFLALAAPLLLLPSVTIFYKILANTLG